MLRFSCRSAFNSRLASMSGFHHSFQTTQWSIVIGARDRPDAQTREESLRELCHAYWYPLFAYLRRKGHSPEDADDLVQGFFAELIEKDSYLNSVDPERGRFRWFLMHAIRQYALRVHNRASAKKRGGDVRIISYDVTQAEQRYGLEPVEGWTPEKLFDRRWAVTILQQALEELAERYKESSRRPLFEALLPSLQSASMPDGAQSYRDLAHQFAMSEAAVKVFAMRMRNAYRDALRATVARTVADPENLDGELHELLRALRGD